MVFLTEDTQFCRNTVKIKTLQFPDGIGCSRKIQITMSTTSLSGLLYHIMVFCFNNGSFERNYKYFFSNTLKRM